LALEHGWDWEVKLTISPDAELTKTELIAVSSDSVILDGCKNWTNLARAIIEKKVPNTRLIDLCENP